MRHKLASLWSRSTALFVIGAAGVLHETVLTRLERPTLLILFAACMGLPAFLSPSILPQKKKDDEVSEKEKFEKWLSERDAHKEERSAQKEAER